MSLRENNTLHLEYKQDSGHTKAENKCQFKSEPSQLIFFSRYGLESIKRYLDYTFPDELGRFAQFVITYTFVYLDGEVANILMPHVTLQVAGIIEAEKMTDQATYHACMDYDEQCFVGMVPSQGFNKSDTPFLHLVEAFTIGIHKIRVHFMLRDMFLGPFLFLIIQLAVINLPQGRG